MVCGYPAKMQTTLIVGVCGCSARVGTIVAVFGCPATMETIVNCGDWFYVSNGNNCGGPCLRNHNGHICDSLLSLSIDGGSRGFSAAMEAIVAVRNCSTAMETILAAPYCSCSATTGTVVVVCGVAAQQQSIGGTWLFSSIG